MHENRETNLVLGSRLNHELRGLNEFRVATGMKRNLVGVMRTLREAVLQRVGW
jgi:hypothetical protein